MSQAVIDQNKETSVHDLFDGISARYDYFNRLASLMMDQGWRKRAIALAQLQPEMQVLDLGAGTGDLSFAAAEKVAPAGQVTAFDLSLPMLKLTQDKKQRSAFGKYVSVTSGRAEALPFPEGKFDAVVSAFVMRNVSSLDETFEQVRRVLKFSGRLVILEFGRPKNPLVALGYRTWMATGVPLAGLVTTGKLSPFSYLKDSIAEFLEPDRLIRQLIEIGFKEVSSESLLGGAVRIYRAVK